MHKRFFKELKQFTSLLLLSFLVISCNNQTTKKKTILDKAYDNIYTHMQTAFEANMDSNEELQGLSLENFEIKIVSLDSLLLSDEKEPILDVELCEKHVEEAYNCTNKISSCESYIDSFYKEYDNRKYRVNVNKRNAYQKKLDKLLLAIEQDAKNYQASKKHQKTNSTKIFKGYVATIKLRLNLDKKLFDKLKKESPEISLALDSSESEETQMKKLESLFNNIFLENNTETVFLDKDLNVSESYNTEHSSKTEINPSSWETKELLDWIYGHPETISRLKINYDLIIDYLDAIK